MDVLWVHLRMSTVCAKVRKSLLYTFGAQCPFFLLVYVELFDQLHQLLRPRVSSFERFVSSMGLEMLVIGSVFLYIISDY